MTNWTEFLKKLHRNPKVYAAAIIAALVAANGIGHWVSNATVESVLAVLATLGFYHKATDVRGDTEDVNPPN